MVLIQVLVLIFVLKETYSMNDKTINIEFEKRCMDLVAEPNFKDEFVIGSVWAVFYNWKVKLENACLTLSFEKATDELRNRYQTTMQRFWNTKIEWSRATLHLNITDKTGDKEPIFMQALLLPVSTAKGDNVGLFQSVRIMKDVENIVDRADELVRISVAMKLYGNGRYLLVADCVAGGISLLVRRGQKHTWKEIDDVIHTFNFNEPGYPVCKYGSRKKPNNKV